MKIEKIDLTPDGRVYMTAYLRGVSDKMKNVSTRPAMLILPGGGYGSTSDRESEPVAMAFLAKGFNAFVLNYSVGGFATYPAPLIDALSAILLIRKNAELWNILPNNITVCGFSAGGHLAAMTAVLWDNKDIQNRLGISGNENRPDSVILSYPVITSGEFANRGSFNNLVGKNPTPELSELVSLEKQVSEKTPPIFIWHTSEDTAVPVENSLLLAQELSKNKISFALHIYTTGSHGLSLCTNETGTQNDECKGWLDMAVSWINDRNNA